MHHIKSQFAQAIPKKHIKDKYLKVNYHSQTAIECMQCECKAYVIRKISQEFSFEVGSVKQ